MQQTKIVQRQKIVNFCREHGSITVRDAYDVLQINSPTKRISELKAKGYIVETEWEKRGDKRYKRYYISEGDNNA